MISCSRAFGESRRNSCSSPFFFNDPATPQIYTLSLHDALPILTPCSRSTRSTRQGRTRPPWRRSRSTLPAARRRRMRSEEHTSELQSRRDLVCRLLLEKKKQDRAVEVQERVAAPGA